MHNKIKGRKLGRTATHRKSLLRNLANQLIEHKEIKTTTAKAKEARSHVERLITYAKKGDIHHRRLAFAFLRNKQNINILFDEIAPVYTERQGGYTRVVKLGNRHGDAAAMSLLQLVDFEKVGESSKKKSEKKKSKATETKDSKKKSKVEEKSETAATAPADDSIPEAEVVKDNEDKQKHADSEQEVITDVKPTETEIELKEIKSDSESEKSESKNKEDKKE
jgi:large subunit ribosomal protein L17